MSMEKKSCSEDIDDLYEDLVTRGIKIRLYPNRKQEELLNKTFGCCRFVYNKMLEERKKIFKKFRDNKEKLHEYKYKTPKNYKTDFYFLKEVDSNALTSEWINLNSAYANFFKLNAGFPKFKSKKNRQSYTTHNTNDNCKIDFRRKKLKLPKIKTWINYRDDRIFNEGIKKITVSKTKSGKYYASILIEVDIEVKQKYVLSKDKIVGFDMSASNFLITKEFKLSNPRFYRNYEFKLKKLHRELSRKNKNSNNRNRARVKLARLYEKINNQKRDWTHKMTHLLSKHFECVILENLNIKGMQQFNSGLSKTISLDFSWNQFTNILKYKMEEKGKYFVLIDRYFASSKTCSRCGYKNDMLELSSRKWTCINCQARHDRDINASINIENEGLKILKEKKITITNINTAVGPTVDAFGEDVRPKLNQQFSLNYESTL